MTEPETTTTTTKEIDPELVTVGQPTEGGCCYTSFEASPTLPTSATTKLTEAAGWQSLGELSENGFTEVKSVETKEFKGWHGVTVLQMPTSTSHSFKAEFIEVNRGAVAKLRYGKGAVDVGADGSISHIKALKDKGEPVPLVFDELESNGYLRRTVIPKAVITSFDEVPHQEGELIKYGMEFKALADGEGKSYDIYRAKPSEA